MERSLPLHDVHEVSGAVFTSARGWRLPERYAEVGEEYARLRERVGVVDRSYRGRLVVSGPESDSLLERLLSSEIGKLEPGRGQLSSLLSAKGKVIGVFRVFRREGGELVLAFDDALDDLFPKTLQKYGLLSDVEIADASATTCTLTLDGPRAGAVMAEVLGREASGDDLARVDIERDSGTASVITRARASGVSFEIDVPVEAARGLWEALVESARSRDGGPVGLAADEVVRVENGEPSFGVDFTGDNFPNEAGFERALTYTKCYVGQEVVARMRTYGHANRGLRGLVFPDAGADALESLRGAPVLGERGEVGRVTSAALSPRYGMIGLSIVHRSDWTSGARVRVTTARGELGAIVRELPFSGEVQVS